MDYFPLDAFLITLENDGFRLTVSDYERIRLALGSGGAWDLARVRSVLTALLVKDEEQREIFLRRFDRFFDAALPGLPEDVCIDVHKVLEDIETFKQRPNTMTNAAQKPEFRRPAVSPAVDTQQKRSYPALFLRIIFVVLLTGAMFTSLRPLFETEEEKPPVVQEVEKREPVQISVRDLSKIPNRVYQVPVVKKIEKRPIAGQDDWKYYALLSVLLLLVTILDGLYLRYLKQPLKDEALTWNKSGVRHFPLEKLGGKPAPRLDDAALAHLADCMGYFQSELASKELNVPDSIAATLGQGGSPELVFYKRKQLRHLIILVDDFAEPRQWNPIAAELAEGMTLLGVAVLSGAFYGDPGQFSGAAGRTYYLEDLEADRNGYLLLIFSDGKGLHEHHSRYTLEAIARWPMAAWLELRAQEFWDESSALPTWYGIPLYPATADGLLRAFGRFMTETAPRADYAADAQNWQGMPSQSNRPLNEYLEDVLGDALPLAQASAMMQPISLGMIDALRLKFHPDLPPERIERIIAIPGTTHTVGGLRFSKAVLAVLRGGFAMRRSEAGQVDALEFLLRKLDAVEPPEKHSLAHLSWEWLRERVHLELEPDQALQQLYKLFQTPLENTIKEDFEQVVLPERERQFPSWEGLGVGKKGFAKQEPTPNPSQEGNLA
ncbi:MAG: hypothetical protein GY952_03485, partial [Rhodobacteraceae bacterium]|nr:hypothetical protein [Paracoccaceae bacterium]